MHILLTRPLEDCSEMILKFQSLTLRMEGIIIKSMKIRARWLFCIYKYENLMPLIDYIGFLFYTMGCIMQILY